MPAYYNEREPFAAQWLRNLIAAGHIAPGVVDDRDIRDVCPADLDGFEQCHFFAGIGVWSYAARLAGWPDDRPLWTGSCPCQPFSICGVGRGFDDERHLWPFWHHLIAQRRPHVVFGEQVASADGLAWLDLVQDDLEGTGYAFAPVDLCAAGIGAPHLRQRLWFVADDGSEGPQGRADSHLRTTGGDEKRRGAPGDGVVSTFWRDADWIGCADGKTRPIEPGIFPLAYEPTANVGRVRAYGNAIVAEAGAAVIRAYRECRP